MQLQAALSGRDVLGIAKTGSGKTAAFVLPMVVHISQQARVRQGEGPIGVVLAPTRELAEQIHQDARRCALLSLGAAALCRDSVAGKSHSRYNGYRFRSSYLFQNLGCPSVGVNTQKIVCRGENFCMVSLAYSRICRNEIRLCSCWQRGRCY